MLASLLEPEKNKSKRGRKPGDGKGKKKKKKSVILKIARKKIKKPIKEELGDGPGPDDDGEYEVSWKLIRRKWANILTHVDSFRSRLSLTTRKRRERRCSASSGRDIHRVRTAGWHPETSPAKECSRNTRKKLNAKQKMSTW